LNKAMGIRSTVVASVLALASSMGWAARSFTPQAGTWAITEELDGKPGRGLAIDVQGNTFFMQVFGYETNGDATFYTATGQMDGDTVTAPLMQYQGGRSFGSDARDAVALESPGKVTVSFANGLQGTVQFPGEPGRAIQRFEMRSDDYVARYWSAGETRSFLGTTLDSNALAHRQVHINIGKPAQDLQWRVWMRGFHGVPWNTFICTKAADQDIFRCTNSEPQPADGNEPYVQSIALRIVNVDLVAELVVLEQGAVLTYPVMGTAIGGGSGSTITGCAFWLDLYIGDQINCNLSITPSSGTWLVEDEWTFKPGRGMAIDVQNGMALAQVFNYLPSGRPTFHMGSGSFQKAQTQLALNRYQGGRALGGPLQSAELAEAAGDLSLAFLYGGTSSRALSRVRGTVALPNEPQKQMVRMALEPGAADAQGLLGQWWLKFSTLIAPQDTVAVTLSRVEGLEAVSDDGAIRCTRADPAVPRRATCTWIRDGVTSTGYLFQEPGNRSGTVLQVRDRHGNLMGLGAVPLE
jgi:hypothetical protein